MVTAHEATLSSAGRLRLGSCNKALRWHDRRLVEERASDVRKLPLGEVWNPQLRILPGG